jgi:hypothetical protein
MPYTDVSLSNVVSVLAGELLDVMKTFSDVLGDWPNKKERVHCFI